jgi:uncharacterized membrane protein
MKKLFRNGHQMRLFWVMVAVTLFDFALILCRMYYNRENIHIYPSLSGITSTRGVTFLFLFWNLVLAWVPYLAALRFSFISRKNVHLLRLCAVFITWFAFFPNAPYIVTDLVHLHVRPEVPFWLDLMLLFSCAFTGLMLGLISLYEMHVEARRWLSERTIWILSIPIMILCGFGIWLGRFQRWNSWDIVTNPIGLVRDLLHTSNHSQEGMQALQITALLSVFLFLGYSMLMAMMGSKPIEK